jgi:hypothetical protein
MITRRSLLGACLAGFAAPAIVRAEILMPARKIIVPEPFAALFEYGESSGYTVMVHPAEGLWWKEQIDFIPVQQYASMKPLRGELGCINGGNIRFIESKGPAFS